VILVPFVLVYDLISSIDGAADVGMFPPVWLFLMIDSSVLSIELAC